MADELPDILGRDLAKRVDGVLGRVLGGTIRRDPDTRRYRVSMAGQFRGAMAPDLLQMAGRQRLDAALVVGDAHHERVLYFERGVVVGATSTVLFELIGRVLLSGGLLGHDDAETLVSIERNKGVAGVLDWVPGDAGAWALEERAWTVGSALRLIGRGGYLFAEGTPRLGALPRTAIEAPALALEGERAYAVWRHGGGEDGPETNRHPRPEPILTLAPERSNQEELDDIMRRVREYSSLL